MLIGHAGAYQLSGSQGVQHPFQGHGPGGQGSIQRSVPAGGEGEDDASGLFHAVRAVSRQSKGIGAHPMAVSGQGGGQVPLPLVAAHYPEYPLFFHRCTLRFPGWAILCRERGRGSERGKRAKPPDGSGLFERRVKTQTMPIDEKGKVR